MSFSPSPIFYDGVGSHPTLYTGQAAQKRTSLVIIGGSTVWGNGLDMTDQYAYKIQQHINSTLATNIGNWASRSIHYDDYCEGGLASGGTPTYVPFNGGNTSSGYGAGADAPSASNFNPGISPYGPSNYGRSKFNFDPYTSSGQPNQATSTYGIFDSYGGSGTPNIGNVQLNGSGQNLRMGCNVPVTGAYLLVQMSSPGGNGAVNIYGAGGFVGSTVTNWSGFNYSGSTFTNGFLANAIPTTPTNYLFQIKTDSGSVQPQTVSIYWNANTVDIHAISFFNVAQATNHILVQTVGRDSYCFQDYSSNTVLNNIQYQVVNGIRQNTSAYSSKPYYVLGDSINSIVTPGRNYTPSDYASLLDGMGKYLEGGSIEPGKIILATPLRTQVPVNISSRFNFYPNSNVGWSSSDMFATSGGSGYTWHDFWNSLYQLAAVRKWGFLDLTTMSGVSPAPVSSNQSNGYTGTTWTSYGSGFFQADGLHPTPAGATAIANQYISQLGL